MSKQKNLIKKWIKECIHLTSSKETEEVLNEVQKKEPVIFWVKFLIAKIIAILSGTKKTLQLTKQLRSKV